MDAKDAQVAACIAWVKYDQNQIATKNQAAWQRNRVCKICRAYAGQVDDRILGALFCHECEEYEPMESACARKAGAKRMAAWLNWAALRLYRNTKQDAQDDKVREARRLTAPWAQQERARRTE